MQTGESGPEQQAEQSGQIGRAVSLLRRGGVVGYPSETVWGLAALTERAAVDRLYQLKGREADKPVQLSCLSPEHARRWLRPGQPDAERLTRFWPGPLTLLAWAGADCPEWLAPGGVVGLRVPSHPVIRALLAATGGTLATTSLNPSGQPAAGTAEQAQGYGLADLLLPELLPGLAPNSVEMGSPAPVSSAESGSPASGSTEWGSDTSGMASTVFDLRTRQVLRQGAISQDELLAALW
ncbi:L-threonylcarbamoyladenylate synthase [Deinococcus altitudinis]|uniref:L-threonylcarbamoyladenylate synthase n=1 Tax=Deinococcus altitudinis TaxID=468914 RepID=UPI003891833D